MESGFDCGDGGFDRGVGDDAEGLGAVMLVTAQLDTADTIGGRLEGEGMDGCVRAD